ncbi:WUSCHEL-related homeobox 9-like isoform X2 [Andrographis paniculata]|uniref:WUSCHEL-related homeobox 9-like isoform X2 n=1 Tax=Andrographis paniculata TaxID=175694 RepID=UPI0021E8EDAE|nr:WUSCHEL-related homeobox 9-like isoform X2 [Andrographis paniculata]
MASSNRHWPSMFKSKPCNSTAHHHQWQHDMNSTLISSTACNINPYSSGSGCEERTPEPKPRWNPRPEQIRILEAIFNSGMVNPPREEIRKIRTQLEEYGQVGDANVFYWFQNRKSRSKHKQRQTKSQSQNTPKNPSPSATPAASAAAFVAAPTPSSSSSEKSSNNNSNDKTLSAVAPTANVIDLLNSNSPTPSVNQPFLQTSCDFLAEPFFFPVQHGGGGSASSASVTQGFCFPADVSAVVADQSVENCQNFLLSDLMLMSNFSSKKEDEPEKLLKQQNLSFAAAAAPTTVQPTVPHHYLSIPSANNQILQGAGVGGDHHHHNQTQNNDHQVGPTKSMVFINDVCFEVGVGPFNVREAFGDDAVLVHSSGQPVLTNDWGVTLQPLQHGAFYYLLRPFAPPPGGHVHAHDRSSIDLI